MASLLSLNVGLPQEVGWQGRTVRTGIWKYPVTGPRLVRRINVDGDGQGDLQGHGGEHRAVLVYQADSYRYWRSHLERDDLEFGAFGENFTVDGLPDDDVCVGDRYRIGEAEFEVTQPRVTCFRLGMRLNVPDMAALLVAHHRPGFYLRVLTEGRVEAGDEITKIGTGPERMSVAEIDALLYLPNRDRVTLRRALRIPALSEGWRGSFRDLLDADGRTDHQAAGATSAWTGFRPLRVRDIVRESSSIISITLENPDGSALPSARPGQYLTVRIAGAGEPAPVRSYSLSSPPGGPHYRISVKREAHGLVSGYLHDSLTPAMLIEAAAPRGDFVLRDGATPVVLISAGVGVTPVLAMLHELARSHPTRPVWWAHATRGPADHAFADEAHQLLTRIDKAHEDVFYSAAASGELLAPGVRHGRLTGDALADLAIPSDATAYVCGPVGFMTDIRHELAGLGISDVHTERFGPEDAINPGVVLRQRVAPHPPEGPPGGGPLVTFARSGLTVPSDPAGGRSLLELAEACDVPTRWSCRSGVCHMCTTAVLSGRFHYDPTPLEPPAEGSVLICCAHPDSELVLEL